MTLLTHPCFLRDRIGWHLPYSQLVMFDLLSCSEEPAFFCLYLDIRAAAVDRAGTFHRYTERWYFFCSLCRTDDFFVKWATVKGHTSVWMFSKVTVHKRDEAQFIFFLPVCRVLAF